VTRYRVLIVDDEAPARAKVRRLLAGDARFTIAGEAADGAAAVAQIQALAPDLVLLDVQMPALTGFEVLEVLGADAAPKIVFSTAYEQYALAAFDAAAVDYLVKPYHAARFGQALDRAHRQLEAGRAHAAQLDALLAQVQPARLERLLVRDGEAIVSLRLDRVRRVTADDKHVRLITDDGEHVVRQSLKALEARLDPARFVRVHRGEIVAVDAVARMEPLGHGDALLILHDGTSVVLSRGYREAFLDRWER
jgi:two-component system LytT family response regulator